MHSMPRLSSGKLRILPAAMYAVKLASFNVNTMKSIRVTSLTRIINLPTRLCPRESARKTLRPRLCTRVSAHKLHVGYWRSHAVPPTRTILMTIISTIVNHNGDGQEHGRRKQAECSHSSIVVLQLDATVFFSLRLK